MFIFPGFIVQTAHECVVRQHWESEAVIQNKSSVVGLQWAAAIFWWSRKNPHLEPPVLLSTQSNLEFESFYTNSQQIDKYYASSSQMSKWHATHYILTVWKWKGLGGNKGQAIKNGIWSYLLLHCVTHLLIVHFAFPWVNIMYGSLTLVQWIIRGITFFLAFIENKIK
jgi:hypothetical protein